MAHDKKEEKGLSDIEHVEKLFKRLEDLFEFKEKILKKKIRNKNNYKDEEHRTSKRKNK